MASEIDFEIIDLMSISPMDIKTISASVAKTGRLLVVHKAVTNFDIGAEIIGQATDQAFKKWQTAPRVRVVAKFY